MGRSYDWIHLRQMVHSFTLHNKLQCCLRTWRTDGITCLSYRRDWAVEHNSPTIDILKQVYVNSHQLCILFCYCVVNDPQENGKVIPQIRVYMNMYVWLDETKRGGTYGNIIRLRRMWFSVNNKIAYRNLCWRTITNRITRIEMTIKFIVIFSDEFGKTSQPLPL